VCVCVCVCVLVCKRKVGDGKVLVVRVLDSKFRVWGLGVLRLTSLP
jgi:hypothetical protein